ncbi:MAG: xanthine dehydrogenase family protein subunit M [Alphaproteobacteria bacterium]
MKPAPFAYARARTLTEAFDLLERHGDDARVLAGGQSLMATLNMRLSAPEVLVDINAIPGLAGIEEKADHIRIGALTRHVEVERSPVVARHLPLIAAAMPHIAHAAIRNRGTFGGSIAFADPAAELPACIRALGATLVIAGRKGERRVAADDFFQGLFATALEPGELLVAAEIPKPAADAKCGFMELARRHGDYAIVGLAVQGRVAGGSFRDMRLAFFGAGDRPMLAAASGKALEGKPFGDAAVEAAQSALAGELDPMADLNGSPAMKLHLARVLTRRVLAAMAGAA